MTQLILNIEDKSVLPMLRKIVRCFKGVTIASPKKAGIDKALEDVEAGRVKSFATADEFFAELAS